MLATRRRREPILSPERSIASHMGHALSDTAYCRSFSRGADGFVRGEGCGVLLLKRLREARASGDRIFGLIVGSAVNQDGASSGLTVPNGLAQQSLLRAAHRRAGIEAWQVGYVEAHGTGTALGDPIEAEALGAVFGERGEGGSKLLIGSVKTNVGHLESAAGVAGLIKVVLGLAARSNTRSAALERSERACSLERVASGGGDGVAGVGADWWSSDWRCEFVWLQRYQRARGGGELGRGSCLGVGVRAAGRGAGSNGADGSGAAGAGGAVRGVSGREWVELE